MADIQTADNIEAVPVTRLFEAYLAKVWGTKDRSLGIRFGLIDLNSQFDTNDTASLMLNSSHGIGPDLSRSGRSGPSIYPVTGGRPPSLGPQHPFGHSGSGSSMELPAVRRIRALFG